MCPSKGFNSSGVGRCCTTQRSQCVGRHNQLILISLVMPQNTSRGHMADDISQKILSVGRSFVQKLWEGLSQSLKSWKEPLDETQLFPAGIGSPATPDRAIFCYGLSNTRGEPCFTGTPSKFTSTPGRLAWDVSSHGSWQFHPGEIYLLLFSQERRISLYVPFFPFLWQYLPSHRL